MPQERDSLKIIPKRTEDRFEEGAIRPINSEDPEEIERIIRERHPALSEELDSWKERMINRYVVAEKIGEDYNFQSYWEFFLEETARISRELAGTKLVLSKEYDLEERFVHGMLFDVSISMEGYDFSDENMELPFSYQKRHKIERDTQKSFFSTGAALAKAKYGAGMLASLNDIDEFFNAYTRNANIRDQELFEHAASQLLTAAANGCDISDSFFETLDGAVSSAKEGMPAEEIPTEAKRLCNAIIRVGLIAEGAEKYSSNEAFKALSSALHSGGIENLYKTAQALEEFVLGAREMGEVQFEKFFLSLAEAGGLLPERVETLLKLEKYFGTIQFSRLLDEGGGWGIIDELIRNAEDPTYNAGKPIALITVPREGERTDLSNMFSFLFTFQSDVFSKVSLPGMVKDLMQGYKVFVFSVGSPQSMDAASEIAYSFSGGKGIPLFIPSGHASGESMNLIRPNFSDQVEKLIGDSSRNERRLLFEQKLPLGAVPGAPDYFKPELMFPKAIPDMSLDIGEKGDLKIMQRIGGRVARGGAIVNFGCEGGAKGDESINLTNVWAAASPGREAFGPRESISGMRLSLDPTTGLFLGKVSYFSLVRENGESRETPVETYKANTARTLESPQKISR